MKISIVGLPEPCPPKPGLGFFALDCGIALRFSSILAGIGVKPAYEAPLSLDSPIGWR